MTTMLTTASLAIAVAVLVFISFFLWLFTEGEIRLMLQAPSTVSKAQKLKFCLTNGLISAVLVMDFLILSGVRLRIWHTLAVLPATLLIYYSIVRAITIRREPSTDKTPAS